MEAGKSITIQGHTLPLREYQGKRVVSYDDIATVHNVKQSVVRNNFSYNRKHFLEGHDYFLLNGKKACLNFRHPSEATQKFCEGSKFVTQLNVFTESGYLMLVKSLTDDLSWQVQRELVNNYFRMQEVSQSAPPKPPSSGPRVFKSYAELQKAVGQATPFSMGFIKRTMFGDYFILKDKPFEIRYENGLSYLINSAISEHITTDNNKNALSSRMTQRIKSGKGQRLKVPEDYIRHGNARYLSLSGLKKVLFWREEHAPAEQLAKLFYLNESPCIVEDYLTLPQPKSKNQGREVQSVVQQIVQPVAKPVSRQEMNNLIYSLQMVDAVLLEVMDRHPGSDYFTLSLAREKLKKTIDQMDR